MFLDYFALGGRYSFNAIIYPVRILFRSCVYMFIKMCCLFSFETLVKFRDQNHIYDIKCMDYMLHSLLSFETVYISIEITSSCKGTTLRRFFS